MKPARILISISIVLIVGVIGMILLRGPSIPDLSKDEPPFDSMLLPPRSVTAQALLDGGSVSISVIDRTGTNFEFAFPHKATRGASAFNEAFYGAVHATEPGAFPLRDPARAKEIGLLLLKNYGGFNDDSATAIYYHLSETAPSSGTKFLWRLRTILK